MIAKLFLRCALGAPSPRHDPLQHLRDIATAEARDHLVESRNRRRVIASFASAMPLVNNAVAARSCISWVSPSPKRAAVWWCRVDDADVNRFVVISSVEGYPPPGRRD